MVQAVAVMRERPKLLLRVRPPIITLPALHRVREREVSRLCALAAAFLMFPDVVGHFLGAQVTVILTCLMLVVAAAGRRDRLDASRTMGLTIGLVGLALVASFLSPLIGIAQNVGAAFTFVTVLPVALWTGWQLQTSELVGDLLTWFSRFALVSAAIAIIEYKLGHPLLPTTYDFSLADVRSTAGQPYPIILGVILTVAMATLAAQGWSWGRGAQMVLLTVGVLTTVSSGPLAVAAGMWALMLVPWLLRLFRFWTIIVAAGVGVGSWLALFVWQPMIPGTTVDSFSNGYRAALYATVPKLIEVRPFGYGIAGLPKGIWLVDSAYLGTIDFGATVDSEPVKLVSHFGIIGLLAIIGFLLLAGWTVTVGQRALGLALLAIVLNGMTVAISAWLELAALSFLLTAAAFLAWRTGREAVALARAAPSPSGLVSPPPAPRRTAGAAAILRAPVANQPVAVAAKPARRPARRTVRRTASAAHRKTSSWSSRNEGRGGLRGSLAKIGPLVIATLASQLISAGAIFLTPLLGFATSDMYALGIGVGGATLAGVTFGVVYPFVLGRPGRRNWNVWAVTSVLFAVVLAAMQIGYTVWLHRSSDRLSTHDLTVLVVFGVGGAALAAAGSYAVRDAVFGKPVRLYVLTIAPNVLMAVTILVLVPIGGAHGSMIPAAAWTIGAFGSLGLTMSSRAPDESGILATAAESHQSNDARHLSGLLLGVAASSIMPGFYTAALTQLAPGTATLANIAARIGSSVVGIGVNTVLMAKYNWVSAQTFNNRIAVVSTTAAGALTTVAAVSFPAGDAYWRAILMAAAWIIAAAAAAIYLREANAKALGSILLAKSALDLVVTIGCAVQLHYRPGIVLYFAAFLVSQALTVMMCGVGLRDRAAQLCGGALFVVTLAVLVLG